MWGGFKTDLDGAKFETAVIQGGVEEGVLVNIRLNEVSPDGKKASFGRKPTDDMFRAGRPGGVYIRVTNYTNVYEFKKAYKSYTNKRKDYTPNMGDQSGRKKHKQHKTLATGRKKHKQHKTLATGRKKHENTKTLATGRKKHENTKTFATGRKKRTLVCSECHAGGRHYGWCSRPGTRVQLALD